MGSKVVYLYFLLACLLTFHANLSCALSLPFDLLKPKDIPIIGGVTGIGNGPPPEFLMTKNPSEECRPINNGAHLCCDATLNGGNALVQALAELVNYDLNPNAVNGVACMYISQFVMLR